MSKIARKQMDAPVGTRKRANTAFTILTGTSAYTTTASFGGSTGAGNDTTIGVFTTSPSNIAALFRRDNGKEVSRADGSRIFARNTFAAAVFTTTLYVSDGAGGETVYSPVAGDNLNNVAVDMIYGECVQFASLLPTQSINGLDSVDESGADPNSHQRQFDIFATPTANQTAFTLSQTPKAAASVGMKINGLDQRPTLDYTITGTAVTFTAVDHSIATTDHVMFVYDR
jgi:hypothetical protein